MTLVALHRDQDLSEVRGGPREVAGYAGTPEQLGVLRTALRRTRAASAILVNAQVMSDLSGVPALDALCIRLGMLLGRPLRSFSAGTLVASFDEAWLLSLFDAAARDDAMSYGFLLRTRLKRSDASEVHFLVCRAQSALDTSSVTPSL
ncbi:hypothetical protein [Tropicimonas sp. S265A]|uniref:hypothetical protein n=1 Tax=Tropicimonas sp. S265A TaxID=3415134 RepID=UPI003C7AC6F4